MSRLLSRARGTAALATACLLASHSLAERPAAAGALGSDRGATLSQGWSVLLGGSAQLLGGLFGAIDDEPQHRDSDKRSPFRAGTFALALAVVGGLRYLGPRAEDTSSADTDDTVEPCSEGAAGVEGAATCGSKVGLEHEGAAEPPACKDGLTCEYEDFMDSVYEDLVHGLEDGDLVSALPITANELQDRPEVDDERPEEVPVETDGFALDSEVEYGTDIGDNRALEEALELEWTGALDVDYEEAMEQEYCGLLGHFLETGEVLAA